MLAFNGNSGLESIVSQSFEFSPDLSAEKTLSIYEGRARHILVVTNEGLKLQFPASSFRPYVSEIGIQGQFRVKTDSRHRLQKLEKIG